MNPVPRLDPDDGGNAHLQALLRRLHPKDVPAFVEKLTKQPRSRFHTYRELLIGVHLRDRGFDMRYELNVGGQTPDWCLVGENNQPIEILDVLTLHQRNAKDAEIGGTLKEEGVWSGWISVPADHIYRKLNDKAGQYSRLAKLVEAPYVLAIYGEFAASVAPNEVQHVLFFQHDGWFSENPQIAGLVYCRSRLPFEFEFTHYVNPSAERPSALLSPATSYGEA